MKRIMIDLRHKMALLLLMMITGGVAAAQNTGDNLSDYAQPPKTFWSMYDSPLPYIIYGVIMLGMAYVLYRFWHDNRHHDDVPHHQ